MRFLIIVFLVASCGTLQVKKNKGEGPVGIQYCSTIEALHRGKVEKIFACTASLKLCQFSVEKAKNYGTMLGLKTVTECREIVHP